MLVVYLLNIMRDREFDWIIRIIVVSCSIGYFGFLFCLSLLKNIDFWVISDVSKLF